MTALLNVGLLTADKTATLAPIDVALAVAKIGGKIEEAAIHESDSEETVVIRLAEPLPSHSLEWLSAELLQDCVAQAVGYAGELQGPKAADWGPFNPAYFLQLDGRRLAPLAEAA